MKSAPIHPSDSKPSGNSHGGNWDIVETRLRLPRRIVQELKKLADAENISMNALVASFIDEALSSRGRPTSHEIAPWFKEYLKPKGGHPRSREPQDDTSEDDVDFT